MKFVNYEAWLKNELVLSTEILYCIAYNTTSHNSIFIVLVRFLLWTYTLPIRTHTTSYYYIRWSRTSPKCADGMAEYATYKKGGHFARQWHNAPVFARRLYTPTNEKNTWKMGYASWECKQNRVCCCLFMTRFVMKFLLFISKVETILQNLATYI